jgi:hypothetical protein
VEYTIEADAEFLRVRMSGRDTDRPPSEVCAAVLDASASLGRMRILIELDQRVPLSTTSQFQLVTRLPQLGMTPAHSIALVHRKPEAQEASAFINVIAANRDIGVRNFPDVDDAKTWLRSRPT